jgi:hypothetical protein
VRGGGKIFEIQNPPDAQAETSASIHPGRAKLAISRIRAAPKFRRKRGQLALLAF